MISLRTLCITALLLTPFTGCSTSTPSSSNPKNVSLYQSAVSGGEESMKSASLVMQSDRETYSSGEIFEVGFYVFNPQKQDIASVSSWLSFDPMKLNVLSVDDADSRFNLFIAEENTFDNENGLIRIQRTADSVENTENLLLIAKITFQVSELKNEAITSVDFLNYEQDENSQTGIFYVIDSSVINIMKEPQTPALLLELLP